MHSHVESRGGTYRISERRCTKSLSRRIPLIRNETPQSCVRPAVWTLPEISPGLSPAGANCSIEQARAIENAWRREAREEGLGVAEAILAEIQDEDERVRKWESWVEDPPDLLAVMNRAPPRPPHTPPVIVAPLLISAVAQVAHVPLLVAAPGAHLLLPVAPSDAPLLLPMATPDAPLLLPVAASEAPLRLPVAASDAPLFLPVAAPVVPLLLPATTCKCIVGRCATRTCRCMKWGVGCTDRCHRGEGARICTNR